ncbi:MAG: SpoIID/LytB domain-containing protein [Desulfobacteraceae bacterium]|nr:MAG: SpoIID/LytB domain-containing protein [Desulfobacteraceae bacterium]
MQRFSLLIFGLLIALPGLSALSMAELSNETLEKEHLSRYYINYASYLIDVGKYLEALEGFNAAEEITTISKTKVDALLAKASLLSSFLDASEEALKVYADVRKNYPQAAEIAQYRQGILLFDMQRFDEAQATLEDYFKTYPQGRFRFQAEALLREIAKAAPPEPTPPPPSPVPPIRKRIDVRVRMCQTTGELRIEGAAVCVAGLDCRDRFTLGTRNGKILFNRSQIDEKVLVFESEKPLKIICSSQEKRVRGKLVAQIREGKLLVINVVDIEDYLLGVVPSESMVSWPVESLKAQSVAARTYAYYQLLHRKAWAYDLVDYAGDQAYGGMDKEHARSTNAVKATTGEVLTYEDKPILAMFSANSGGFTADSQAIFNLSKPYLTVHRDPESLKGGMANWTRKYSVPDVVAALRKINVEAKGLEAIEADERASCGRIIKVRLVLSGGETKILRNRTTLRRALDLPEILHGIRLDGNTFIFEGHGWGHGVGYSSGAQPTWPRKRITGRYYPSTMLVPALKNCGSRSPVEKKCAHARGEES